MLIWFHFSSIALINVFSIKKTNKKGENKIVSGRVHIQKEIKLKFNQQRKKKVEIFLMKQKK